MGESVLTVRTRKGIASFRRCGIEFTREPRTVKVTDDQAAAIRKTAPTLEILSNPEKAAEKSPSKGKGSKK